MNSASDIDYQSLWPEFAIHELSSDLVFCVGRLPMELVWDSAMFEDVWRLHPDDRHRVKIWGKWVETPRWQQAFGVDYEYSGSRNNALPIPQLLQPLLDWVCECIDVRCNGLLINWYEGAEDYIGPHHDSIKHLVIGAPIVTISSGEERIFRLSNPKTKEHRDFSAGEGSVFVLPYDTNRVWKHSVPKSARYFGRRISVTLRAFSSGTIESSKHHR